MKRILICGANSFVGHGFADVARKAGYEVDLYTRSQSPYRKGNIIGGSYLTIHRNQELAEHYDYVVNFAILKDATIDDNINYIAALTRMCIDKGVSKLIHFSSIMVYSRGNKIINESTSIDSSTTTYMKGYGLIKIATDEYIESIRNSLPFEIVTVRPGFVLASDTPCPFVRRLPAGFNLILGDNKSTMPIVRRSDIHVALIRIMSKPKNLPVYLLFPNNCMTKVKYVKETYGGRNITLPMLIFKGIPYILAKCHIIPWALYSRFEGMFTQVKYSSQKTEEFLDIKFL